MKKEEGTGPGEKAVRGNYRYLKRIPCTRRIRKKNRKGSSLVRAKEKGQPKIYNRPEMLPSRSIDREPHQFPEGKKVKRKGKNVGQTGRPRIAIFPSRTPSHRKAREKGREIGRGLMVFLKERRKVSRRSSKKGVELGAKTEKGMN